MRVLLVRPRPHPGSIGLSSFMICEPLELEYAAAALEAAGHRVEIADMILERRSLAAILRGARPDLVGFTAYITHVGVIKDYARVVKRELPGCPTMVGGVHAAVLPADFEDPAIDFILHAAALAAAVQLAGRLPGPAAALRREIAGVWDGPDKPYPREPELPGCRPAREATSRYRERYDYLFHSRCALLKTSIGCAYDCDFCFCTAAAGHRLVERPLADVIDELRTIRERNIFIVDDNFLFRPERVLEFCRLLEAAGERRRFILFGRADFLAAHPQVVRRFAAVGLHAVFVGLESFREGDLPQMGKRSSVAENERAVRVLGAAGVECYCGIIVGPDWETSDFAHLRRRLIALGRPLVNIQPLTPLPGTPLFERLGDRVTLPRERHECWDLTHLVLAPTRMSTRRYYAEILRAYYHTTTSLASHRRVLRCYGARVYLRTVRGSLRITLQYLRLIARG